MTLREKVKAAIWDVMDRRFGDAYDCDADEAADAVMEAIGPIVEIVHAAAEGLSAGHWLGRQAADLVRELGLQPPIRDAADEERGTG